MDLTDKDKEKELVEEAESEEVNESDDASKKMIDLQEQFDDLKDQNLRLQAEIQNMHRRNKTERELSTRYRSQDLAKEMLPVLDNLERALETEVTDEAGQSLKQGIEMVIEGFKRALTAAGVEEIEAKGQPFDPNFHESYAQVPDEEGLGSGMVAEVYEKGYKLHDRVLRAAKVTVTE